MKVWLWGILAVFASLAPFYFLELDSANRSLAYPLYDAAGDSIFSWSLTKALMEGTIIPFVKMELPRMGAPFGPLALSEGFPYPEQLQLVVLRLFGFAFDDPIRVQNVYYLFGYVLTSLAFYGSAIWLGIRAAIAFGLSIAFTYLNYHLVRYHHLALSQYWVLAPAAAIVLKVWDRSLPASPRNDRAIFFAALVMTAWHSYYGYFFVGIYGASRLLLDFRLPVARLVHALAAPALGLLIALGLSTAGHFAAVRRSDDPPTKFQRFAYETRYYRLRLFSVLLPTPHHRVPSFADARDRYTKLEGAIEGTDEAIGFLAIGGLACGIYALIRAFYRKNRHEFAHFGGAQLLVLFFASSFGISMWVAALVSPTFRSVNRISPMLAAMGLFTVGAVLSKRLSRFDGAKGGEFRIAIVGVFLGGFAVWDQVPRFRPDPTIVVELDATRKFTRAVEERSGSGAVLQLPFQNFPEGGPIFGMPDYAHQIAAVFGDRTRWSYGHFKGTRRSATIAALSGRPTDVVAGKELGLSGIWIDRAGYPDRAVALEAELRKKLGRAPLVSEDGRRSFFSYD